MVGYSDSNKDAGFASARWALQRAQIELVAACDAAGVELTIFHGRGGTISRGGSRTHEAVLSAPRGSVKGRLRVTEQGEIINAKYGLRGIAMRTLEQALGSGMLATARPPAEDPDEALWHSIVDTIAEHSRTAYRSLVYDSDGFGDYFREATPIDVIERMRIGSRPASRRARTGIADLRAIPWVFAWTQSRCILPGWYGFGTGLAAAYAEHGVEAVERMARLWPFMHCLLDDAEMVLAKVELDIAERYDRLASPQPAPFFERIRAEFERTVELVLQLRRRPRLLDQDDTLRRAIRLRNPYVDPMSLLQVEMLERWRESGRQDESLFRVLLLTVNGIAHGLQNTG